MVQKVVIDACVLFPTVVREITLGAAEAGLLRPLWSERILGEWERAVVKLGPLAVLQATGEIALVRAKFPQAMIAPAPHLEARLYLPDENDRHVFATAVSASADAILTVNAKDFPRGYLAEEGVLRLDPDNFLRGLVDRDRAAMQNIVEAVVAKANSLGEGRWDVKALLKKARLNRLAKALA